MLTQNITLAMKNSAFKSSDWKYLLSFIVPASVGISLFLGELWSLFAVVFVFGFIPLLELMLPIQKDNSEPYLEIERSNIRIFDYILYLNVPIVFGLTIYSVFIFTVRPINGIEWFGYISALGILYGSSGINVAHELGHRHTTFDRILAKLLLLPSHYMHFIIEHNLGHHKYVSTPEDPATARLNEPVYVFWARSTFLSYLHAWRLENRRLSRQDKNFFTLNNRMIQFTVIQIAYNVLLYVLFGWQVWLLLFSAGVFGFLLLETINYIEHYGLMREKMESGRYEQVLPKHSWNADFPIGRILLYELTRHSDHHYKSDRKYQVLRSIEQAPDLPWGYPASMLVALFPPLWFRKINPLIKNKAA